MQHHAGVYMMVNVVEVVVIMIMVDLVVSILIELRFLIQEIRFLFQVKRFVQKILRQKDAKVDKIENLFEQPVK